MSRPLVRIRFFKKIQTSFLMKMKFVYTLWFVVFLAALNPSNSAGPAGVGDSGYTGAPGDGTTCAAAYCHGDGDGFASSLEMIISDATGPVNSYIPDSIYNISFTISAGAGMPSAYGFQALSLSDSDQMNAGQWLNPSSNAHVVMASTGRSYLEHHEPSTSNVFTTQWKAPSATSGPVTIYANANAVDLSGDNSGDDPTESVMLQLTENSVSSAPQADLTTSQVQLFPVPVHDKLSVSLLEQGDFSVEIMNVAGQLIFHAPNEPRGRISVNTSSWAKGLYVIRIRAANGEVAKKFVKH
jgi:hypothetical protein